MGERNAGNSGHHFQRIDIKEPLPVELHSGKNGVVKGALHHVRILAVNLIFQHFGGKEHQADGGAGLRIGSIAGQIIVCGERLADNGSADAAGYVHATLRDAFPQPFACGKKLLIAGHGSQVGHAGIKVDGADGVAHGVRLAAHGQMALGVPGIARVGVPDIPSPGFGFFFVKMGIHASYVDEMLRQGKAMLISGGAVEL